MMLIILQSLLHFAILPSIFLTVSMIICGDSRPLPQPVRKTKRRNGKGQNRKHGKKRTRVGKSGTTTGSKTVSGKTRSGKTGKSEQSSRTRSGRTGALAKSEESGKSSRRMKEMKSQRALLTESSRSSKSKRSSRWERFPKSKPKQVIVASASKSGSQSAEVSTAEQPKPEIKLEPRTLSWIASGGVQKVFLTNPSEERRAIKIKCSDNTLYRVNPVFAFVEPGQTIHIDVVRQNGGPKTDKLVFLWTKASRVHTNARALFNNVSSYPMIVLPLTVNY